MIHFVVGNLLESTATALVNTVNTVGVMGKGIALQFKNEYPSNYKAYRKACKEGELTTGKSLVFTEESLLHGKKTIINFPTKTDWRKPSEYQYIESGLEELVKVIEAQKIKSIAIPPLGAGNGGLDWNRVKPLIEQYLANVDCEIYVYQPNYVIQEVLKKERVKLTPARAMLLAVLFELVRNGEFVSEFAAEKIAYFLQRFGAQDAFKLKYEANFYGPYSGKVKHVLFFLNGSYIIGYGSKDKKPFDEIGLIMDVERDVLKYLEEHQDYKNIVQLTKNCLAGYYSPFALELLSTVDFIAQTKHISSIEDIKHEIGNWSDRKKELFAKNAKFIDLAFQNLQKNNLAGYN